MKAYRCTHSGLLLPPDYKQNWGIYYGHGLGPVPVSECLDSDMRANIDLTRADYTDSPDNFMFPFHHSCAPIEAVDVTEEEFNNPKKRLILHIDDPKFTARCAILRGNQVEKAEWSKLAVAKGVTGRQTERTPWRTGTEKAAAAAEPQPQE